MDVGATTDRLLIAEIRQHLGLHLPPRWDLLCHQGNAYIHIPMSLVFVDDLPKAVGKLSAIAGQILDICKQGCKVVTMAMGSVNSLEFARSGSPGYLSIFHIIVVILDGLCLGHPSRLEWIPVCKSFICTKRSLGHRHE